MLKLSDTNIENCSAKILGAGFDVAFLVPTDTAISKSIVDAHDSLRAFLKRNEVHDYSTQSQGPKHKIKAHVITEEGTFEETVSMYRPKTKKGDPRICIYGLKKFANSYNLIALIHTSNELFIVNCSTPNDLDIALQRVIPKPIITVSPVALELLTKLKAISKKGYTPSLGNGDMAVGKTVETLLGIPANSSRKPDYKGIELKTTRVDKRGKQRNKNQLFSKTPEWNLSPIDSAKNLVLTRGYIDKDNHPALRHTISGDKPNSLGLYLDIDYANDYLRQMFTDSSRDDFSPEHDMTWLLSELRSSLVTKHKETFWVKAKHNNNRENEEFYYVEAIHTANPFVNKLETLLETGLVTVDYTHHLKENGQVRDHGFLFKLKVNHKEALFPKPIVHDLTS